MDDYESLGDCLAKKVDLWEKRMEDRAEVGEVCVKIVKIPKIRYNRE